MGRKSTKENKNVYQRYREKLGLTREGASNLMPGLSPERIEKIENERSLPHPDEILLMADGYQAPQLCNHYCSNECPIGKEYVPSIEVKDLSRIVLEMLASLNRMNQRKERLIEITFDGVVQDEEVSDFVAIQDELEKISIAVETLQLWTEQMLASGAINMELYDKKKRK